MPMIVLGLVALVALIDDNDGGAFCFVVETALPVLLVTALSIAEVSNAIEDQ